MNGINKILKGDKVIWILALLLGIISLVVVYSAASALVVRNYDGNTGRMLMKHAGTLFLGYLMMFIAYKINYQHYSTIFKFVLWLCVPLLLYTMIFGNNLNQASRTINVFGFSFQPSEWAKIALITYTARELVVLEDKIHDLRTVLTKIAIPILLITGLIFTENLSTAVILLTACIVLLIVGRVKFMHILAIGGLGIILLGCYIAYDSAKTSVSNSKTEKELTELVSEDATVSLEFTPKQSRVQTWINRINTMFEDDEEAFDPFDDHHYQQTYAKIAVASSSFFGKGPGKSEQRNFLPHPYSDFIFAIIVEEYGILGAIVIILIYIIILTRVMRIMNKRPMTFGAYMSFGLCFLMIMQAMINMGVSIGLLPVTGQPLPFISMGGTSIMATGFMLGMILSVTKSIEEEESGNDKVGQDLENTEIVTENTDTNERAIESCD